MTRALALAFALLALLPASAGAETVWAVGDGGTNNANDDAVAQMIEDRGLDRFLYLGDIYDSPSGGDGTLENWQNQYGTSFGRFKQITSPTIGNHEWENRAAGYDVYWGALAPQTNGGHYYSFDLAGWHFVSLNSVGDDASPFPDEDPAQAAWLRTDLAPYAGTCTVAFMHHSRWSAGQAGETGAVEPLWAELAGRVVLALSGHDHNFQRLQVDRGIRPLVVGTGGHSLLAGNQSYSRLERYIGDAYGALRMDLSRGKLDWQFVSTAGETLDSGTIACEPHTAEPTPPDTGGAAGTPVPAAIPVAVDSRAPRLGFARSGASLTRSGLLRLRLGPADEDVTGTIALDGAVVSRSLGRRSFSLRAGQTRTLRLRLPRRVRRAKRLRVRAVIRVRDRAGNATRVTRRFVLRKRR